MDETSSLPSSERKRVRFNYDEPDSDDGRREKKARFPKGKKEKHKARDWGQSENGGPIKSTDPRVAATRRAVKRTVEHPVQQTQLEQLDDIALPNDILDAEEEDVQRREDIDDIALEPFNLKQEREEGYFDADGNYVEYKNDNDAKDAWLDSAEVDTSLAAKHMKQYAEEEVEHTLSTQELAALKLRIACALQTGETVLQALRRLKASSTEKDKYAKAKMSSETKASFDMLTEDAMKLLDHGEFNVYNERKEDFECDAEASTSSQGIPEAPTASFRPGLEGNALSRDPAQESLDMFGDEDNDVAARSEANTFVTNVAQESLDMFGDEDNAVASSENNSEATQGEAFPENSGYIYDDASGYYYNSALGYYYDSSSGLFCNAASGIWYQFDADTNSYSEISQDPILKEG